MDTISFFFILFLTATVLLTLLLRHGFSRSITFFNGLRFGLFWIVFVVLVLVMNQTSRETLDQGRWSKERLFAPVVQDKMSGKPVSDLLFGWFFFPVVQTKGVVTGVFIFLVTGIILEISGRILVSSWRSRWTTVILLGFLLLNLMTYSAIGFIRHVAWVVIT